MKTKKKYWLLSIFVIFIAYMLWGPLFPWNPIKIGYTKISASKATIYVSELTEEDSVVYRIDEIIKEEEKFHGLQYVNNFKIIVLNKGSNNKRYLPWLNGSGYSVSVSPLNLIYIGAVARNAPSGIESYLKHELSHLLIDQNTTFSKAMTIHKQSLFTEGIAEYFSGHGFYSKNELMRLMRLNNVELRGLEEKKPQDMSWQELRMKYSYYKYFIEFLVETYGLKKLQDYLKIYLNNPGEYKKHFLEIYAMNLEEMLERHYSMFTSSDNIS